MSSRQGLTYLDCRDPSVLVDLFEATAGTVVLEDITALSVANQCVLRDRLASQGLDARLIAMALMDQAALLALVDKKQFSESLYFRLNVVSFEL